MTTKRDKERRKAGTRSRGATVFISHHHGDEEMIDAVTDRIVETVGGKRILTPKFGAQLRRLRGRASRGEVCRMLTMKGLPLDRSTLLQYERGTVRNPSVAILWTLSQHYGLKDVQFCDLVMLHTQELTGGESSAKDIQSRDDVETRRLATIFRGFPTTLQKAVMAILLRMQAGDADVARLLMSSRERRVQ